MQLNFGVCLQIKWQRELGPKRKVELYGIWQTDLYKPPPIRNVSILIVSLSVCCTKCNRELDVDPPPLPPLGHI